MTDFRIVADNLTGLSDALQFTYQKDDRTSEGLWSRPNTPVLIFSDIPAGAVTSFTFHGGPIAGAPRGHSLQLVFWGSWWLDAGAELCKQIQGWTRALLDSPYFNELRQYGITHAPVWREPVVVTKRAPPMSASDNADITEQVLDLIGDLIFEDLFPDPDDGPRILFVVLLPDGFVIAASNSPVGAHRADYDIDLPFDTDNYWAGWVRPQDDREAMMRVISHEVVEMMTDPEGNAWYNGSNTPTNEICDVGFSGGTMEKPGTAQTAYVNGARVQSYWSNAHRATIIPIDSDYGARLSARMRETARRPIARGTFRIDASDRVGCPEFHECCIEDRDYKWRVDGLDERARVRLSSTRFAKPVVNWTINGTALAASPIILNLDVEEFTGRSAGVINRPVTLRFSSPSDHPDVLDIFADNPGGNFEITVGCTVTDGSIEGNVATNVVATPTVTIGFACAELLLERAYTEQKSACLMAMLRRYIHNNKPLGRIRPEEGINWDSSELVRDRPAYFLPSHYQELRWLGKVGRAAHAVLAPEDAARFTRSLVIQAPVLSRTLQAAGLSTSDEEGDR